MTEVSLLRQRVLCLLDVWGSSSWFSYIPVEGPKVGNETELPLLGFRDDQIMDGLRNSQTPTVSG